MKTEVLIVWNDGERKYFKFDEMGIPSYDLRGTDYDKEGIKITELKEDYIHFYDGTDRSELIIPTKNIRYITMREKK